MISKYIKGFVKVLSSISKIGKYNLWSYLMLTGIISLIIGASIFYIGYATGDDIGAFLIKLYPFDKGADLVEKIADVLGGGLVVISGMVVFKYLVLGITSPIMSFVSEKVEYRLTGERVDGFSMGRAISELIRGIRISISNFLKEIFLVALLFILGLIFPIVAPIIAILTFLVQAYFAGYAGFDYYMERRFDIYESNQTVKQHKWGVMGVGSGFLVVLLIPILGWIFSPLLTTIAATEYAIEEDIY